MRRMDWDDLRYVLAVAREGSLSGAARRLGVNHATVLRRITAFEQGQEISLFDRTARGYRVAPRRRRVMAAIEAMEGAALGVERAITATRSPLAGVVRVTSTDTFCYAVLPPILAGIHAQAEGLMVELNSMNLHADLSRLDADIAIRPARSLPPELTGVRAGRLGFAVYAAPGAGERWLALSGQLRQAAPAQWMAEQVEEGDIAGRADSFLVLREMAARGQGRAILPCVLGDEDARLVRLEGAMPPMAVDIWVASHVDLAEVPRIRAVREILIGALERDGARLLGAL